VSTSWLQRLQGLVSGELPPPPVATLIGFRPVEVERGSARVELEATARHTNPMGTLHGGILCDLADAAMGFAMASTLDDGETFTTIDLTAKYLKPVWTARLTAVARVTKRTRTLGLIECEITDEGGSLVAKVFSTCMALRGDEAKGR
jgi:uncharacterized protein (TIGR00369 family)